MRSNFRPNIRLATNILLVIGTFAIALKIAPIAEVYQEKNLCIKYLKHQIDRDKLIKRLKIVKQANSSSLYPFSFANFSNSFNSFSVIKQIWIYCFSYLQFG